MASDGSVVIKITGNTDEFKQALNEAVQSVKKLASVLNSLSGGAGDDLDGLSDASRDAADNLNNLSDSAGDAGGSLDDLSDSAGDAGDGLDDLSDLAGDAGDGLGDLGDSAGDAGGGLDDLGDSADDADDSLSAMDAMFQGSFLATLAAQAIDAVVNAIQQLIANVLEAGKAFTSSMSQVAATMGMTVDEVNSGTGAYQTLSEAAKLAGETTKFSASEAADALNYLALAGYSAGQAADALPAVLNLAAAGGLELAYASDLATDAMSALGIEASNESLTRFGDEMARTASKANTSVAQLGEAILTVGATARSLSGGTVELNTALGILADAGIKGAEGGTKLRNMLLSLSAPTSAASRQLNALGVSVFDSNGQMRALKDIFGDLNAAMSNFTDEQKITAIADIFNTRDLGAVNYMLEVSASRWEELGGAIESSAGAMQSMADTQLNNLEGDLKLLDSALEGLYLNIYEALEPALRGLAQAAAEIAGRVSDLVEQAPWLVNMIAGAAVGIAALTAAMVAYTVATKIAAMATAALGAALWPVTLIVAAIGALIGLVAGLNAAYKEAHAETYALVDATNTLVESIEAEKAAFLETADAIQEERGHAALLVDTLTELIEKEDQTASDKAAILDFVNQLNEAVPGLSLAYDEQTNSLNMTSAAILDAVDAYAQVQNAEANANHQTELRNELIDLQGQLEANRDQQAVESAQAQAEGAMYMTKAQEELIKQEKELLEQQKDVNRRIALYEGAASAASIATDVLSGAFGALTEELNEGQQAAEDHIMTQEELAAAYEASREAISSLTGGVDLCAGALAEQSEQGSLSLDTILALVDAGYAAALAVDEETGAVTLNKDTYIALTQAKIEAEIQSLQTQIASVEARKALVDEGKAAIDAAQGYANKARMEQLAIRAAKNDTDVDAELAGLNAKVAALEALKDSIGSYGGAVSTVSRASSSASKKVKTQAEKDLERFKEIQSELDHLRTMGELSDKAYRDQMEDARDTFLTDKSNLDEYRRITETIHSLDKQAANDSAKTSKEAYDGRIKALQKSLSREQTTQEEYLERMSEARKEFLTEGTEDWQNALESEEDVVYSALRANVDNLEKDYETALGSVKSVISEYLSGVKSEYEDALNELQQAQANMQSKLASTGDLFTLKKDKYSGKETFAFTNLQDQIDAINNYEKAIEGLKERGISDSLMQEILGMDTGDATRYANELLKKTDKDLETYLGQWEELQTRAAEVSKGIYAPEIEAVNEKQEKAITDVLESLPEDLKEIGQEAAAELAQGLQEKGELAVAEMRSIREQIDEESAKIAELLKNGVNSEVLAYSSKLEFSTNAASERESVESSKRAELVADRLALTSAGGPGGDLVMTIDGIEFARVEMPYWRQVEDQSPRIVSD